jgi:putative hemin transport protein
MKNPVIKESQDSNQLKARFEALKQKQPELRSRNAAEELGVSEGELLACQVGDSIFRLQDEPQAILEQVKSLGEVMALTRNEYCVHERKGVYDNGSFEQHGPMKQGIFVNPDIDLRLFMNHWKYCFAAIEGTRKSLQFFDKSGVAIHKIYLTPKSNEEAFGKIVSKFIANDQPTSIEVEAAKPKKADRADSEIDQKGFREAWENLQDTHDFYAMLRKFDIGRRQALRLIGKDFAYKVSNSALRDILMLARDTNCPIMVFVGNHGCIQIHTGEVKKLVEQGPWYNVLDPMFNLHLREDKIESCWVAKKPTKDGIVTSLEIFDSEGELIATLFGKRKPGIPELKEWRQIVEQLKA